MKLSTFTAFLATVAATAMAAPLVEERDIPVIQNELGARRDHNSHSDPKPCQEASPPTENVKVHETEHRKYRSSQTDVSLDSLFSYRRPAPGSKYGTLTIANAHTGRKIIELWSGQSRLSFEVWGRQECTTRLTVQNIDHYRVWEH